MHEALIITALLSIAIGLRVSKSRPAKKLGALAFLSAMGVLAYFLTHSFVIALICFFAWFFIPLIDIHFKRSKKSYPKTPRDIPLLPETSESFFPNASLFRSQLEELGFDEISNHSWQWIESFQHHRFYWNPEKYTIASICLCELDKVAFTYLILHSELSDKTVVRTTNFPFTCPLLREPSSHWKHVPCEEKTVAAILKSHETFVAQHNPLPCSLQIPDPDLVATTWSSQFERQAEHNAQKGLIKISKTSFRFTKKGLLFIWVQAVKDLIRLC